MREHADRAFVAHALVRAPSLVPTPGAGGQIFPQPGEHADWSASCETRATSQALNRSTEILKML